MSTALKDKWDGTCGTLSQGPEELCEAEQGLNIESLEALDRWVWIRCGRAYPTCSGPRHTKTASSSICRGLSSDSRALPASGLGLNAPHPVLNRAASQTSCSSQFKLHFLRDGRVFPTNTPSTLPAIFLHGL